jgi:hypothetical protein
MRQMITGTTEGTGAALTIETGFVPDYIEVINTEDGDRIDKWFTGMADDTSIAIVGNAGPVLNAADGITPYAGTRGGDGAGFTLGTDISENGKTLHYVAFRNIA